MVKKSELSKKLTAYSAMTAAVIATGHKANAQIIYTGLNPADTIPYHSNGSYDTTIYLDLNNDGIADFRFEATGQAIYNKLSNGFSYSDLASIKVTALHNDSINLKGASYASAIPGTAGTWATDGVLAVGDFRNRIVFTTSSFISYPQSTYGGQFYNVTDRYLPLRLKSNGNTYYGWARLTTVGAKQLIISSYAYNSTPGASLNAGNTGCSLTPVTPVVIQHSDTLLSSAAVKYQWYLNGSPLTGDTLSKLLPPTRGYYSVVTIDENGCRGQALATYFACYSVNPVITENSNYSNPNCGPAELQAVNLISGTYIQWLLNGATISGATSGTYFASGSGNYTAEFINSDKTCSILSDTVPLTINALPPLPELKRSCDTLNSVPTSATIAWYYEKTPSDSLINDTQNTLVPVEAGNYIVNYTYTNTGCSTADTINFQSSFYTSPAPTLVTNNNFAISCKDEPITISFSDSVYYNQHGDSLQWYLNNVPISGANKTTYVVDTSGAYYLSITSGACFKYSDTLQLTIKPSPPAPALKQTCDTLTSVPTTAGITWYYEKSTSDSLINDNLNRLQPIEAGNYIINYTDTDGCVTVDTINFQPLIIPVIATQHNRNILCDGTPFIITLTNSADYNNYDTLQWYINDTAIVGANSKSYTLSSISGESASFYLSATNYACSKNSDTLVIMQDEENPTVTRVKNTDTLITQPYSTYQWFSANNIEQSNGNNQYFIPDSSGIYFVLITDSAGCGFQSPDYTYTNSGIAPVGLPGNISIYAYDKVLHIQFTDEDLLGSSLTIYNTLGQKVFVTTLTAVQTLMDMSALTPGLYIAEVSGKQAAVVHKVVIE